MKLLSGLALLGALFLCSGVSAQKGKAVYTKAEDLTLIGKVMPAPHVFHRVDTAAYSGMPAKVKYLYTHSAGLAVCFKTNSPEISAKWCVSPGPANPNMAGIMNKGLDLYIKRDGKWVFAGVGKPVEECNEGMLVQNMDDSEKECLLYLPLYDETFSLEIGVKAGASLRPLPDPFRKRVVVYGSSIVQGASASRPGMAYPAIMTRRNGIHFMNLGVSGSAKMEKEVADMLAGVEADAFILDCVPNSSPKEITERTAYLVNTLRERHPEVPIIVIQTLVREGGNFDQKIRDRVRNQNINIAAEVAALQKKGVKKLYFIKEEDFLGTDHEGSVDGIHPSDLGFERMLGKTEPAIMKILKQNNIY